MEIGFFQLESLILTNARFSFCDLRDPKSSLAQSPPITKSALDKLLARATKVAPENLATFLASAGKESPVVLLCENGRRSQDARRKLENLGFLNVYVVEGGVEGLLVELDEPET